MIYERAADWDGLNLLVFFHISNLSKNNNNHNKEKFKGEQLNQFYHIVAKDFYVLLRSTIYISLLYYID